MVRLDELSAKKEKLAEQLKKITAQEKAAKDKIMMDIGKKYIRNQRIFDNEKSFSDIELELELEWEEMQHSDEPTLSKSEDSEKTESPKLENHSEQNQTNA